MNTAAKIVLCHNVAVPWGNDMLTAVPCLHQGFYLLVQSCYIAWIVAAQHYSRRFAGCHA